MGERAHRIGCARRGCDRGSPTAAVMPVAMATAVVTPAPVAAVAPAIVAARVAAPAAMVLLVMTPPVVVPLVVTPPVTPASSRGLHGHRGKEEGSCSGERQSQFLEHWRLHRLIRNGDLTPEGVNGS